MMTITATHNVTGNAITLTRTTADAPRTIVLLIQSGYRVVEG